MIHSRRYIGYFMVIVLSVAAISIFSISLFKRATYARTRDILWNAALLVENVLLFQGIGDAVSLIDAIGGDDIRLTVIRSDGEVLADSRAEVEGLDNHARRPEVIAALKGDTGVSNRYSNTLDLEMMYVARPLKTIDGTDLVIRASMGIHDIEDQVRRVVLQFFLTGIVTFFAISLITWLTERRLMVPYTHIQRAAEAYASGNLDFHITVSEPEDARVVAEALNDMATALRQRIIEISNRGNEFQAIFTNMVEAVVVLDDDLSIREINPSALDMVGMDRAASAGRSLIEVFRNSELEDIASQALAVGTAIERTVTYNTDRALNLQVHASRLSPNKGIVLVMNDISKLKALERMRKDFVANVSHELKTPITTIKGYLETLIEGAYDDPETADKFLRIAGRNADRLNAIIDDLLSLSRLEQGEGDEIEFERCSLESIVANAVQACAPKAAEKRIQVRVETIGERTEAEVNPLLTEQAVTNLVDNAVKYGEPGSTVTINLSREAETARIVVADNGIGIPDADIPRIFERFYRVDKARSRDFGGTGLGLAIVKHIALVHRGRVSVESRIGEGSVFTLEFPVKRLRNGHA